MNEWTQYEKDQWYKLHWEGDSNINHAGSVYSTVIVVLYIAISLIGSIGTTVRNTKLNSQSVRSTTTTTNDIVEPLPVKPVRRIPSNCEIWAGANPRLASKLTKGDQCYDELM